MKIFIHGKDHTETIRNLADPELIAAYFEEIKDRAPVGMESKENWQARNEMLLDTMLTLAHGQHESKGQLFYGRNS